MNVIPLTLSPLGTNCYIVPTGNGEAVVIDPADEGEKILAEARKSGLEIKKILLTHGHFDHTGAAAFIREQTGAPIYVSKADEELLTDSDKSLAFFCPGKEFNPCSADTFISDGDEIRQGDVTFRVMSTPGHTAGSVCFLCVIGGQNVMFSGDTLFRDSIGRSDTYSGDQTTLFASLDRLKALEDDYIVYTGHGESTKLSTEKRFNPFLSDMF
ncbi:MAG: MBL fold metallo-hydrolase [Ruminiclostridium sp.]|nr:MBL fold metallo-hydrolase [Ruminiclostridium sp.]